MSSTIYTRVAKAHTGGSWYREMAPGESKLSGLKPILIVIAGLLLLSVFVSSMRGLFNERFISARWDCQAQANVRTGPGVHYPVVFVADCSGGVHVRSGSETQIDRGGRPSTWVEVRSAEGQGWANRRLLTY